MNHREEEKDFEGMQKEPIYVSRVREVQLPLRSTPGSAGYDFFIPRYSPEYEKDLLSVFDPETKKGFQKDEFSIFVNNQTLSIEIPPGSKVKIPSGIHYVIPENHAWIVFNKSGRSFDDEVLKLAEVCDEDYQGEIVFSIWNTSSAFLSLKFNQKLLQAVLLPVVKAEVVELPFENIYKEKTLRGEGGFSSTGLHHPGEKDV